MTISLDAEGAVMVNDQITDPAPAPGSENSKEARLLPELKTQLQNYAELAKTSGSKPVVILSAHDKSKGQRFVDVLNVLAEVGIKNVTLSGFTE